MAAQHSLWRRLLKNKITVSLSAGNIWSEKIQGAYRVIVYVLLWNFLRIRGTNKPIQMSICQKSVWLEVFLCDLKKVISDEPSLDLRDKKGPFFSQESFTCSPNISTFDAIFSETRFGSLTSYSCHH
ncbi:hypothetical protein Plhal304r1_c041g0119321 [Plasmopara halstedii]